MRILLPSPNKLLRTTLSREIHSGESGTRDDNYVFAARARKGWPDRAQDNDGMDLLGHFLWYNNGNYWRCTRFTHPRLCPALRFSRRIHHSTLSVLLTRTDRLSSSPIVNGLLSLNAIYNVDGSCRRMMMSALLTSLSFYMTLPLPIVRDGHALASNAHHLASLGTFPLLVLPLCLESAVPAVSRIHVYKPFSGPLRGQAIQAPLLLLSTPSPS